MGAMQKFLLNMIVAGGVLGVLVSNQTDGEGGLMNEEEELAQQFNPSECEGVCQIQGAACNEDALIDDEVSACLMALSECLVACDESSEEAAAAGAGGAGSFGGEEFTEGKINNILNSVKRQVCKTNCGTKGRECAMVSMNEAESSACEAATDICIETCKTSPEPDPNVPDLDPKELVQKGL